MSTNIGLQDLQEQLFNHIEAHILAYHVSLGSYLGSSVLPPPCGSGTFVKFAIPSHTVYGILTAAHVVKELKFGMKGQPVLIGLSKLLNGDTIACASPFFYIHACASIEGFNSTSNNAYRPDIAFIALGIDDQLPKHELIDSSSFYDLDGHTDLVEHDPQIASAFFRGAAPQRPDGLLDTAVHIGGGELLKRDNPFDTPYWSIPNTSNKSIAGGSGAGFWRFDCGKELITKSLEGVIISEEETTYSFFEAMASEYIYGTFLPELKSYCVNNLPSKK